MSLKLVISTIGDLAQAEDLASQIVTQKLAVCVNILPVSSSVYFWEGKIAKEAEFYMLIKTSAEKISALESFISKNHPYQTPCFLVLDTEKTGQAYADWAKNYLADK